MLLDERVNIGSRVKEYDLGLLLITISLIGIGLLLIYSAGHAKGDISHFNRQLIISIAGIIIMIALAFIPPRVFYALAYVLFGLSVLLLIMVLAAGVVGLGAKRWLILGGFHLQPSEPAKIGFILAASRFLADWRESAGLKMVLIIAALGIPVTLIVLAQPDLGTSTVFPIIAFALLAWYGLPLKFFVMFFLPVVSFFIILKPWLVIPFVLAGLVWLKKKGCNWVLVGCLGLTCIGASFAAPFAWNRLEPYQKKRLTTFLDPSADPLGAGYQVIQSRVAIGSGGLTGMGLLKGTQTQLRFLPQQHTDFIFSLAGEELGFIGTSLIVFLYSLVGWRGFRAAARIKNQFIGLVAAGLTTMIMYHCVVNIGIAMGNLPVTGLPLPFLSYGGSFLLTCAAAVGVILSAGIHRRDY